MELPRCPGQDLRYWKPGDVFEVPCPHCNAEIEFFKDEPFLRCRACGKEVRNPKLDLACAQWCQMADKCLGIDSTSPDRTTSISESLIVEMKAVFGSDRRRIDHALKVLGFADQILESEQADQLTVKAAAILHDIGILEAERKHGSVAGRFQEEEGPPIAREILRKLEIDPETIEHVSRIVGSHHSAKDIDTPEFRIVWDADWLANIPEDHANATHEQLIHIIDRVFRTKTGRQLAEQSDWLAASKTE